MISFGKRLKELRLGKRYTMIELGGKIGVAKSTIAGYESGFREPSLKVVISLARALEVSTDYLLGISNYPTVVDFFTPINESPPAPEGLHWDGIALEEDELEEIKRMLENATQRKDVNIAD